MSPIFLMAISTDTVHIFNEFTFRRREVSDRREAIRQTLGAVATPVLFSDLTTIAGFAALAIGPIIPVSWRYWRHGLTGLSARHALCIPDLLGFGRSPKPRGDYSIAMHVEALTQCSTRSRATS